MEHALKGIQGNAEGNHGKTGAIIIPIDLCKKIEEAVEEGDLADQHWVLKMFHLTKKTLSNYISSRKIPQRDYTVAFNNTKWFFKSRLFGLKNLLRKRSVHIKKRTTA